MYRVCSFAAGQLIVDAQAHAHAQATAFRSFHQTNSAGMNYSL